MIFAPFAANNQRMPIRTFSAEQAMANLRARRSSLWPERWRGADRLKGIAEVEFEPSFHLVPGEAVMTIGSCFARNIETRLEELATQFADEVVE